MLTKVTKWMTKGQPYRLLRSYQLATLSALESIRHLDLRGFTQVRDGLLYLPAPNFERVWVPLSRSVLPRSARATAVSMIEFLNKLRAEHSSHDAVHKAGDIVVTQFKWDLLEMRIVLSLDSFKMLKDDGCVFNFMMAEEYTN